MTILTDSAEAVAAWLDTELTRREQLARAMEPNWWLHSMLMTHAEPAISYAALVTPEAVLQRLTADRLAVAHLTAQRHEVCEGDPWYTCAQATEERDGGDCLDDGRRGGPCDCGRDARVQRGLQLLAQGYGWTPPPT